MGTRINIAPSNIKSRTFSNSSSFIKGNYGRRFAIIKYTEVFRVFRFDNPQNIAQEQNNTSNIEGKKEWFHYLYIKYLLKLRDAKKISKYFKLT